MLECPVFGRFLRVERIVDTVGVCGSNPHAPTSFLRNSFPDIHWPAIGFTTARRLSWQSLPSNTDVDNWRIA